MSCIANIASLFFNAKIVYYKGSLTYYDSYIRAYDDTSKGNRRKHPEKCYFCYFFAVTYM
ncbi:hypothetical protein KL86DYS2_20130 [uncultured Dysgonomonas sp.]|uniref:Uncharacterized protein n=1 Tax=uncultured Dysgonomonas sp. TaxID=206096 RepID=A0A212KG26_9BACT|nr:hypothetical protein KL86DYS2_20130 [uncultured Dysgonomonas sp.]